MKLKELKVWDLFNIEKSSSYPKLKTNFWYIDIRDRIANNSWNCDDRDVFIMSNEEVADKFWIKKAELQDIIDRLT